jgi:hypothetical protein
MIPPVSTSAARGRVGISGGMLELTVPGGELHMTDLHFHERSLRPEHPLETTIGAGAVARFPIDATDSE